MFRGVVSIIIVVLIVLVLISFSKQPSMLTQVFSSDQEQIPVTEPQASDMRAQLATEQIDNLSKKTKGKRRKAKKAAKGALENTKDKKALKHVAANSIDAEGDNSSTNVNIAGNTNVAGATKENSTTTLVSSEPTVESMKVAKVNDKPQSQQAKQASDSSMIGMKGRELKRKPLVDSEMKARMKSTIGKRTTAPKKVDSLKAKIIESLKTDPAYTRAAGTSTFDGNTGQIFFAYGSSDLSYSAQKTIGELAAHLLNNEQLSIGLTGNTDALGSAVVNKALSLKRVKEVQEVLVQLGIDTKRIKVASVSYNNPLKSNNDWLGRQQNRRVDIEFLDWKG